MVAPMPATLPNSSFGLLNNPTGRSSLDCHPMLNSNFLAPSNNFWVSSPRLSMTSNISLISAFGSCLSLPTKPELRISMETRQSPSSSFSPWSRSHLRLTRIPQLDFLQILRAGKGPWKSMSYEAFNCGAVEIAQHIGKNQSRRHSIPLLTAIFPTTESGFKNLDQMTKVL